MLKTSVVISTYNGERYLPELLDSIKNQSMKPDEVVICDDCSKDGTVEYIHSYIAENDLLLRKFRELVRENIQKTVVLPKKHGVMENGAVYFDEEWIWIPSFLCTTWLTFNISL